MPRIRNVGGVRPQPFLYVPAVSRTVRFGLSLISSLLSSRRYYCSGSKPILYLDTFYCKFSLYVIVEMNPLKHRCFSAQTNLVYLGLVYVTIITGIHSESTVELRGVTGV